VRVSGKDAITFTEKVFTPSCKTPLHLKETGTLTFGVITDTQTGETVDEVLVSLFRTPHSYTGEDSTEISCHGSAYILNRVVQLLIDAGCTLARPGEYTQRAFLNGKMDLSQAEAVADLIASSTAANHRIAMQQMRGGFSNELKRLREQLLHITALLELELDFSDHEDLEFASRAELGALASDLHDRIRQLCQSFKVGNAMKTGIPVAIVGETNAGKSTLLNALLREERALVSDVRGTTRDTIEETTVVGGTLIRFIDTAGLRQTSDEVEQMGIERTRQKIEQADIILWVLDANCALRQFEELKGQILGKGKRVLLLVNKCDQLLNKDYEQLDDFFARSLAAFRTKATDETAENRNLAYTFYICARREADVERFRTFFCKHLAQMQSVCSDADIIVSNARHYEALQKALAAIERVQDGLQQPLSADFIAQDLRECIHHLSDIAGEVTSEGVLQTIFSKFCVGK